MSVSGIRVNLPSFIQISIPPEIVFDFFKHLNIGDLGNAAATCRDFKALLEYEPLWAEIFHRHYPKEPRHAWEPAREQIETLHHRIPVNLEKKNFEKNSLDGHYREISFSEDKQYTYFIKSDAIVCFKTDKTTAKNEQIFYQELASSWHPYVQNDRIFIVHDSLLTVFTINPDTSRFEISQQIEIAFQTGAQDNTLFLAEPDHIKMWKFDGNTRTFDKKTEICITPNCLKGNESNYNLEFSGDYLIIHQEKSSTILCKDGDTYWHCFVEPNKDFIVHNNLLGFVYGTNRSFILQDGRALQELDANLIFLEEDFLLCKRGRNVYLWLKDEVKNQYVEIQEMPEMKFGYEFTVDEDYLFMNSYSQSRHCLKVFKKIKKDLGANENPMQTKTDGYFSIYRNNLKNRFWTASALPQNLDSHSRLAHGQWSLAPNQNSEEPPCPNPDSSGYFSIMTVFYDEKFLAFNSGVLFSVNDSSIVNIRNFIIDVCESSQGDSTMTSFSSDEDFESTDSDYSFYESTYSSRSAEDESL